MIKENHKETKRNEMAVLYVTESSIKQRINELRDSPVAPVVYKCRVQLRAIREVKIDMCRHRVRRGIESGLLPLIAVCEM